tara:strand:+ start:262 stop:399 length:138 start_codon:yes stop_codon:yes gene_type:complete
VVVEVAVALLMHLEELTKETVQVGDQVAVVMVQTLEIQETLAQQI